MLLGNGVRDSRNPLRRWGLNPGGESENFVRPGALRNFHGEARVTNESIKASYPSGYRHPYTWSMARTTGALASRLEMQGDSTLTAAGALGRNLEASFGGTSTLDATGQLVVSATASIAGTSSMTGNLLAALGGDASLAGTSSMTGTLTARGWVTATLAGTSGLSATSYATGRLEADLTPFTELSPTSLAEAVWTQALEAGYTAEQMMRVMAAALAGEVSGAGTSTVTIRDIADTADRIVASVDGTGNRTAVTLDVD
jgi:hypothetical protein